MTHLPFDDRPFRHRIGARPLDLPEWLEPGPTFAVEMAEKDRLLNERHGDVFATLDERALDEGAEVVELVHHHMSTYFPNEFESRRSFLSMPGLHPLDVAGRIAAEDFCLMAKRNDELVLTAASLCFPNRWRLAEKLGKTMLAIHEPVALYAEHIGPTTDSFLDRLRVDRPVWRTNWGLADDPALFQATGHGNVDGPALPPEQLFLRVERQALIRLPITDAILFSIRTFVTALPEAVTASADRMRLAAALRALPPEVAAYKSMSSYLESVIEYVVESTIAPDP